MQVDLKSLVKDEELTLPEVELVDIELKKPFVGVIANNNKKNQNNRSSNRSQLTSHDAQFINHISYLSQVYYYSLI